MNYLERLRANNIIFSSGFPQSENDQAKTKYLEVFSSLSEEEKRADIASFCKVCIDIHTLKNLLNISYADIYTIGCIADVLIENFGRKNNNPHATFEDKNVPLHVYIEYYGYILNLYIAYQKKGAKWWKKYTQSISDTIFTVSNNIKSLHKATFKLCKNIYTLHLPDSTNQLLLESIFTITDYAYRLQETLDILPQYTGAYHIDRKAMWDIWLNKKAQKIFKYFLLDFYPLTLLDRELIKPFNNIFTQLCISVHRVLYLMARCDGIQDIRVEHMNYYIFKDQQLNRL